MDKLQSYCPKKCCVKWSSMSREKDKNAKPRKSHGKRLIRQSCGRRRALYSGELKGFDIFALFLSTPLVINETLIRLVIHEYRISGNVAGRLPNFSPWSAHLNRPMQTQSIRRSKPPPDSLWTQVICVLFEYMHTCIYKTEFKRSGNPNILK